MKEKLYSVFRENSGAHMVFSQNGYVKDKIYFKDLNLLILRFPERNYHFLVQNRLKYEYHEGDEFTHFLKTNAVNCAEFEIAEIIDAKKGLYKMKSGSTLNISPNWIESGYQYHIDDPDQEQPSLFFNTGKIGVISVTEADLQKDKVSIEFAYQGTYDDPEIQKFLKGVKSARRGEKVTGCVLAILMVLAFILIGKIWTWIFGEPDDPFLNLISIWL